MPETAIKIKVPAITDAEYNQLLGELRKLTGLTLRSWAMKYRYAITTTYDAARGRRGGPESKRIQKQLEKTLYATSE